MGLVDHVSFLDQEEILDDLKRTLDSLDLNTKVLELVDFTWVHVGIHASQPDVAWSFDSGLSWHFDGLSLDLFLEVDVVGFSKDETDLTNNERSEFSEIRFGLELIEELLVLLVLRSVAA